MPSDRQETHVPLNPEALLGAYAAGFFPMTDPDGNIEWYTANPRGILPLDQFQISRSLRKVVRDRVFDVRINCNFREIMAQCRLERRGGSWISEPLIDAYCALHKLGFAHSVECYFKDQLVGGLYGVSLGSAFFGESMFHRATNASKVALVHLVSRLRERHFELLDAQARTEHLAQFGCISIPAGEYLRKLRRALEKTATFA